MDKVIQNEIIDAISLFASAIIKLDEDKATGANFEYSDLWREATKRLSIISNNLKESDNSLVFPSNLFEQYQWMQIPLDKWRIMYFPEIFENDSLDNEPRLFLSKPTDYCYHVAYKEMDIFNNKDLKSFKAILDEIRDGGNFEIYTLIREFFVRNSVVDSEKLNTFIQKIPEQYRANVRNSYENVPDEYYVKDEIKICPYCGWTLKYSRKGFLRCDDSRCKRYWTTNIKSVDRKLLRVKKGVRKYIVYPGIPEINLYDYVSKKGLKAVLYPHCDTLDLLIDVKGEKWVVDVKDWGSAHCLARSLNEKNPFKNIKIKWDKAFLILPDHFSSGYISTLNSYWDKDINVSVMTLKNFKKTLSKV